ncbi:uncharacterized protein LOC144160842 [Haemaphysalis longicornis]
MFAGLRNEDVDEWLDTFERVSAFNRWDDRAKLENVSWSLDEVAKTWFRNNVHRIDDWNDFTTQLRQIFGSSSACSDIAKKKLEGRFQHPCETYTSYIEDVVALCRKVNKDMTEADRVRHILKGIGQFAFNALALQNPTTVSDVRTTCQRLDNLQSLRLQQGTMARNSGDEDLRALIRELIREELDGRTSVHVSSTSPYSSTPNLREIIREELAACTHGRLPADLTPPPVTPSYSEVAGRPPLSVAGVPAQPVPGYVAAVNPVPGPQPYYPAWRPQRPQPSFNRPVCFYCGIRGHISRFCRRRLIDERRGYDTYERDRPNLRYDYRQRGYPSPPRRSSPPATSESPTNSRASRRRSPSPFRRSVSPLRPVVHDPTHLSEN